MARSWYKGAMSPLVSRDSSALWSAIAQLLAVAAGLFILGLLLGLFVVGRHGGGPIQGWDNTVERWFVHNRGPLVPPSKFVATYLDALPLAIIAIVLSLILLATLRTIRAAIPIVAYLGGEFQVFIIREIIHRHRPPTANYPAPGAIPGVHETSYSYPSGHAVAVTAMLFALLGAIAISRRIWWPWLLALLGSLFVMDTRLVLGVHWFSDVVFGFVLGVGWGITVAVVFLRLEWSDLASLLPRRWREGPMAARHMRSPGGSSVAGTQPR
jgi:membrane-associated phospholipid phosphatase